MTAESRNYQRGNGLASLLWGCAGLLLLLLTTLPLFAWYGFTRSGTTGLIAALVAGAVCWLGATLALLVVGITSEISGSQAVNGVLLGMLFRMALPLAALFLIVSAGGAFVEAGAVGMLLANYFLFLVAETLLSLRLANLHRSSPEAS